MRRGAAAPRRASPMDLFSGATQPHQGRLGPEPALSRTRRAQRSGRGSRTLQVCKSATRAGAHAPRKTPLLCARVIPPLFGGGGRICISNLVDSPMQGGDARGNVRYTAIGRISDRVLIATYHHYTTGAPASKVLHLALVTHVQRAHRPCLSSSVAGYDERATMLTRSGWMLCAVPGGRAESAEQRQGAVAAERQCPQCRRRCQLLDANRQEVHVHWSVSHPIALALCALFSGPLSVLWMFAILVHRWWPCVFAWLAP